MLSDVQLTRPNTPEYAEIAPVRVGQGPPVASPIDLQFSEILVDTGDVSARLGGTAFMHKLAAAATDEDVLQHLARLERELGRVVVAVVQLHTDDDDTTGR